MKNIIVCMKIVPKSEDVTFDPIKKTLNRAGAESQINDADKNAIEYALRIKEKEGGKVILLSMGPPMFEEYLKIGIAMGADDAVLLSDRAFAGSDTLATAFALSGAIRKIGSYDLILLGDESSDGGTGQVPAQVAELLDLPQILFASDVNVGGNYVTAKRTMKGGEEIVESEMPALVSAEFGSNQPRFPDFRKKKFLDKDFKVTVWSLEDIGINAGETGLEGSFTVVDKLIESNPPSRMRQFIDGNVEEQSKRLIDILGKF